MDSIAQRRAGVLLAWLVTLALGCGTAGDGVGTGLRDQRRATNEMWMKSYPNAGITPDMNSAEATDRMQRAERAGYGAAFKSVIPKSKSAEH